MKEEISLNNVEITSITEKSILLVNRHEYVIGDSGRIYTNKRFNINEKLFNLDEINGSVDNVLRLTVLSIVNVVTFIKLENNLISAQSAYSKSISAKMSFNIIIHELQKIINIEIAKGALYATISTISNPILYYSMNENKCKIENCLTNLKYEVYPPSKENCYTWQIGWNMEK